MENDSKFSNLIVDLSKQKTYCCIVQDVVEKNYSDLIFDCWEILHFAYGMKGINCYVGTEKSLFNQAGFKFSDLFKNASGTK